MRFGKNWRDSSRSPRRRAREVVVYRPARGWPVEGKHFDLFGWFDYLEQLGEDRAQSYDGSEQRFGRSAWETQSDTPWR